MLQAGCSALDIHHPRSDVVRQPEVVDLHCRLVLLVDPELVAATFSGHGPEGRPVLVDLRPWYLHIGHDGLVSKSSRPVRLDDVLVLVPCRHGEHVAAPDEVAPGSGELPEPAGVVEAVEPHLLAGQCTVHAEREMAVLPSHLCCRQLLSPACQSAVRGTQHPDHLSQLFVHQPVERQRRPRIEPPDDSRVAHLNHPSTSSAETPGLCSTTSMISKPWSSSSSARSLAPSSLYDTTDARTSPRSSRQTGLKQRYVLLFIADPPCGSPGSWTTSA